MLSTYENHWSIFHLRDFHHACKNSNLKQESVLVSKNKKESVKKYYKSVFTQKHLCLINFDLDLFVEVHMFNPIVKCRSMINHGCKSSPWVIETTFYTSYNVFLYMMCCAKAVRFQLTRLNIAEARNFEHWNKRF